MPDLDASDVIASLRQQVSDLSYQLALSQAQIAALQREGDDDE